MAGGRSERGSRRRTHAASVVVPFPRGPAGDRPDLARFVPSGRSLLVVCALLAGALGAYWVALSTPVFAVDRVEVQGATGDVAREVRAATADIVGRSLLSVDAHEIEDVVRTLPSIAGVYVDRAFPNTLVVRVAPERAVAVVRRGRSAWLAAGSGSVIREIELGTERALPRIWVTRHVAVHPGRSLPAEVVPATRALEAAHGARLPRRVKAIRLSGGQLTLVLRRGPELRLGEPTDVVLKVTVAAQVFPLLDEGTVYLDVSVPERPVSSTYLNS